MTHFILVTGTNGQLGVELRRADWSAGWEIVALDRAALDLTDAAAIAATSAKQSWAAIINAAAYTAVVKAESDQLAAWKVNALAPAALAAACAHANVPIVQVSTDYVFPGNKAGAWMINDAV